MRLSRALWLLCSPICVTVILLELGPYFSACRLDHSLRTYPDAAVALCTVLHRVCVVLLFAQCSRAVLRTAVDGSHRPSSLIRSAVHSLPTGLFALDVAELALHAAYTYVYEHTPEEYARELAWMTHMMTFFNLEVVYMCRGAMLLLAVASLCSRMVVCAPRPVSWRAKHTQSVYGFPECALGGDDVVLFQGEARILASQLVRVRRELQEERHARAELEKRLRRIMDCLDIDDGAIALDGGSPPAEGDGDEGLVGAGGGARVLAGGQGQTLQAETEGVEGAKGALELADMVEATGRDSHSHVQGRSVKGTGSGSRKRWNRSKRKAKG